MKTTKTQLKNTKKEQLVTQFLKQNKELEKLEKTFLETEKQLKRHKQYLNRFIYLFKNMSKYMVIPDFPKDGDIKEMYYYFKSKEQNNKA